MRNINVPGASLFLVVVISSTACSSNSEGRKTSRLNSHPSALSEAVSDSFLYAVSDNFNRKSHIQVHKFSPISYGEELCPPADYMKISNHTLRLKCRISTYNSYKDCKDIDGCVKIKVHSAAKDDKKLNELLLDVLNNPCKYIPDPADKKFHWGGFFVPNFISYGSLNCGDRDNLPYSKVVITYGEKRVDLKINPSRNQLEKVFKDTQ